MLGELLLLPPSFAEFLYREGPSVRPPGLECFKESHRLTLKQTTILMMTILRPLLRRFFLVRAGRHVAQKIR